VITWPTPQIPLLPGSLDTVKLFDSTTQGLVDVTFGDKASMYVCGITPYDATHIGHAATYVAFDVLNRALRDAGKEVTYASNVTDVDDPLLERANATGADWQELAASQIALFAEDMTALGVIPPDVYVGAVESVPSVVRAVQGLVAAGSAYPVPVPADENPVVAGAFDYYADLSADTRFGSVAPTLKDQRPQLFAERGGDPTRQGKRGELDPLLWRAARVGEPSWDGESLGYGRPGWHIECALIALEGLGSRFSVLGGGNDLLFPHHEMSTSHARVLTGDSQAGARVAAHAGLVAYQGEKMSKSLGNLVFVSKLRAQGINPMVIRLALLAQHYRTNWEWTDSLLEAATERCQLWLDAFSANGGADPEPTLSAIRAALREDLDTPRALASIDQWAQKTLELANTPDGQLGVVPSVEGAPGVISRAANALLGIRL